MPENARLEVLQLTKETTFEKLYRAQRRQEDTWDELTIVGQELDETLKAKRQALQSAISAWEKYEDLYSKYMPVLKRIEHDSTNMHGSSENDNAIMRRAIRRIFNNAKREVERHNKSATANTTRLERIEEEYESALKAHKIAHISAKYALQNYRTAMDAFNKLL